LRDRQCENANAADERHQNRDDDRNNRTPNEKLGHAIRASADWPMRSEQAIELAEASTPSASP
jgi:hypothetical protein